MKQGEIAILPFPFSDLTSHKLRPALIISNEKYNLKKNIMVICISTKMGVKEYSFLLKQENLESGTLQKKSYLRFQNIFTLEKRLIRKVVAKLNQKSLDKIRDNLREYI